MPFSLTLQASKAKFPTSTKTDPNKSVFCELSGNSLNEDILFKLSNILLKLLLRFYKPLKGRNHTKFPEERL